jgi:hypothetical protein
MSEPHDISVGRGCEALECGSKLPHSKAGCARKCRRVDMGKDAPTARERFACAQEAICGMVFGAMKDKL